MVEGKVTNKTGRRTITRMSLANVPQNVMCQITGHKNANSLDRYDDSLEVACKAAMQTLEPLARYNDFQYPAIKDQVTKMFWSTPICQVIS